MRNTGIIPESSISPSPDLVDATSISGEPDTDLLSKTVVLKLNGGLGTGMGLDKAKSLLKVKGDGKSTSITFLFRFFQNNNTFHHLNNLCFAHTLLRLHLL